MGFREQAQREALGECVRAARTDAGLSLRALAQRVGASASTLSAVERGVTRAEADLVHAIAEAVGLTETQLRAGGGRPRAEGDATEVAQRWREFPALDIDPAMAGAIAAFVELGYHGAGMRAIAERAGMSVPGVYHHYRSKQDLLVAILDLTMADLIWRIDAAVDDARRQRIDPLGRLALVVEVIALFHASRRDLGFIGASEMRSLTPANRRRIAKVRTDVQHRLDAEITTCAHRGLVDVDDIAEAGRAISTMCTSICQWFRPSGRLTPPMVARDYAEFAMRLVGAPAR